MRSIVTDVRLGLVPQLFNSRLYIPGGRNEGDPDVFSAFMSFNATSIRGGPSHVATGRFPQGGAKIELPQIQATVITDPSSHLKVTDDEEGGMILQDVKGWH